MNQLDDRTIAQYGKFANRIDRVLGENPTVVSPDEDNDVQTGKSDAMPFGLLTPMATFPDTEKDLATVQNALDEGRYAEPGQATEADIKINNLEREVALIRAILGEAQSKDKVIKLARAILEAQERVGREIVATQKDLRRPANVAPSPRSVRLGKSS